MVSKGEIISPVDIWFHKSVVVSYRLDKIMKHRKLAKIYIGRDGVEMGYIWMNKQDIETNILNDTNHPELEMALKILTELGE